eukprot:TRINITY_DN16917_c0_g1_i1.p1 TRINITY_DN16917_c0_g1~~TRINITY_DN16917_c0_g1_i1.p1  ORF type:complete len:243 (+),score=8.58 TRINITY_DN16917_c0_g1_i1:179-907(+)
MALSTVACSALNCTSLGLYPTALPSSSPNRRRLTSSEPSTSFCKSFRENCQSKCRSFKQSGFQTRILVRAGVDVFVLDFDGVIGSKEGKITPSIAEALSTTQNPFYIVAENKEAASKLLREEANIDIPADSPRILPGTGGICSKKEALKLVASRPVAQTPDATLHFMDDDAETLQAIADEPDLKQWQLYHATWNTQATPDSKRLPSRVRQASEKDFPELLRWGLLMGVDDGCQEYEDGRPAA